MLKWKQLLEYRVSCHVLTSGIVDCFAQYTQAQHALLWQKYYKNLEDTLVYFQQ